jgi:Mg-chelatase subunit ChlI
VKAGPQVVVAVGLGYLLGRTKKMRLALMIAAASAGGKLGVSPRQLLQQGYKRLAASPEMGKITESLRGELLDAAKSAAMTAATGRIESLNERLQDQLSAPGKRRRKDEDADDAPEEDDVQDAEDADDYDEDDYEDEEPEDEGSSRKRSSSNGKQPRASRSPVRRARR